jgi:hypothetical protein
VKSRQEVGKFGLQSGSCFCSAASFDSRISPVQTNAKFMEAIKQQVSELKAIWAETYPAMRTNPTAWQPHLPGLERFNK